MPTYVCSTDSGRLNPEKRAEIARSITTIHSEEGDAARYFVQVIFNELQQNNQFVAGRSAPSGFIWVRADIRSGRTDDQKNKIMNRIATEVAEIAGVSREDVWVYICDIPANNMLEYGLPLPVTGQEDLWFANLPDSLQKRLKTLL